MTTPDNEQISQAVRQLWKSRGGLLRSLQPLHLVGYGLVLLGLVDLAEILIPPVLLNPNWEFQAFGQIIERVPVMLIGLGFIFAGGPEERLRWEMPLVRILSWLTLVAAILFFLLLPLSVVNTLRIDRQNQQQIATQAEELQAQVAQAKEQVAGISTEEELINLVQALSGQEVTPAEDNLNVPELKDQITTSIEENQANLLAEAENAKASRRRDLLEKSLKWNIGTIIAGFIYMLIWRSTLWARQQG
ncbi:MAG: HpsJ family protein [Cyanobacteria bacterium]|nr:HpsJ family protein [Cyanobacteriota bacterium]MDA0865436.1 HpsJ family protein [Cyanobacteriota bacterium]